MGGKQNSRLVIYSFVSGWQMEQRKRCYDRHGNENFLLFFFSQMLLVFLDKNIKEGFRNDNFVITTQFHVNSNFLCNLLYKGYFKIVACEGTVV